MNQLGKFGIIGCGMIGEIHLENILSILDQSCVCLYDISIDQLEKLSNKYGISEIFFDLEDFSNNVDSVIISSPPYTHLDYIEYFVKADKNILVEKPLCTSLSELQKLEIILRKNYNKIILDGSLRHSRLQPKYKEIKSIIKDHDLGEIYHVNHTAVYQNSRPGLEYNPGSSWFFQKEKSAGGPFVDWGVYDLSFHLGLFNDEYKLIEHYSNFYNGFDSKSRDNSDFNVEEHFTSFMKFEGFNYYYERSSNCYNSSKNETRIYGSRGGLKFNYLAAEDKKLQLFYYQDNKILNQNINLRFEDYRGYESDHHNMIKYFIDCISLNKEPHSTIFDSLKILKLILKIYEESSIHKFHL